MTDGQALASMLDDLDPRPIFIDSKDLHSAWCNTAALRELGVADTPDPAGGVIHRGEDGQPSGLLSEAAAVNIVWPHVARVATAEEKMEFVRSAVRAYNAAGYTGVVEMATDENVWGDDAGAATDRKGVAAAGGALDYHAGGDGGGVSGAGGPRDRAACGV